MAMVRAVAEETAEVVGRAMAEGGRAAEAKVARPGAVVWEAVAREETMGAVAKVEVPAAAEKVGGAWVEARHTGRSRRQRASSETRKELGCNQSNPCNSKTRISSTTGWGWIRRTKRKLPVGR